MTEKELYLLVKMLLVSNGNMSETTLAKEINVSQTNLNRKIKTGTLRFLEMKNILDVLGYKLLIEKDGKQQELK